MSFLLNLKTHSFKGSLVLLCCWCSLQINAQDDPADLDKFAYKIPSTDSTFIQKALKKIPNTTYVYLAVCSTYGDEFRIWDSESQKPKSVKAMNLAKWIDEATTQKLISANKDIVLITCAKASVSQLLANALGIRDKAAKRTIRKIIGWEDEMLLYANGHIQGYGKCQQFSATPKGVTAVPVELRGEKIPQGSPTATGTFVVLTTTQNMLSSWLSSCEPDSLRFQLQAAAHEYKANSLDAYNYLVANKTCFEGWKYLKQVLAKSPLCVNTSFLCRIAKVKTLYLDKPDTGDIQKQYQLYFERFVKLGGTKREFDIQKLEKAGLDIADFEALVDDAISGQAVTDLFDPGTTITGSLDQQLTVLSTSEPKLSAELNTKQSTLPEQLWKDLRDTLKISRIKGITTLKDARGRLTDPINIAMGKYLNINAIRDITSSKMGFITQEGNWGAIFESWVETHILNAKNKKKNLGKWTFYFENGAWSDKFSDKSLPKRTLDCSYNNNGKVGVEVKHIQSGFNKKQQEQLDVNAVLAGTEKIKRIEYIFSKETAAKLNEIYFLAKFYPAPNKTIPFKVYYIDADGKLEPFTITKK